jgi:hypothetical protein
MIKQEPILLLNKIWYHAFLFTNRLIGSQGDKAVHMGDIFPTTAHKNPLWVTAYDDYPMQSIREKERNICIYVFTIIAVFYSKVVFIMIKQEPILLLNKIYILFSNNIGSCFIMMKTTLL